MPPLAGEDRELALRIAASAGGGLGEAAFARRLLSLTSLSSGGCLGPSPAGGPCICSAVCGAAASLFPSPGPELMEGILMLASDCGGAGCVAHLSALVAREGPAAIAGTRLSALLVDALWSLQVGGGAWLPGRLQPAAASAARTVLLEDEEASVPRALLVLSRTRWPPPEVGEAVRAVSRWACRHPDEAYALLHAARCSRWREAPVGEEVADQARAALRRHTGLLSAGAGHAGICLDLCALLLARGEAAVTKACGDAALRELRELREPRGPASERLVRLCLHALRGPADVADMAGCVAAVLLSSPAASQEARAAVVALGRCAAVSAEETSRALARPREVATAAEVAASRFAEEQGRAEHTGLSGRVAKHAACLLLALRLELPDAWSRLTRLVAASRAACRPGVCVYILMGVRSCFPFVPSRREELELARGVADVAGAHPGCFEVLLAGARLLGCAPGLAAECVRLTAQAVACAPGGAGLGAAARALSEAVLTSPGADLGGEVAAVAEAAAARCAGSSFWSDIMALAIRSCRGPDSWDAVGAALARAEERASARLLVSIVEAVSSGQPTAAAVAGMRAAAERAAPEDRGLASTALRAIDTRWRTAHRSV